MDLIITPGIDRLYSLALVDGEAFTRLSEHDTPDQAVAAKRAAERAAHDAAQALRRIAA